MAKMSFLDMLFEVCDEYNNSKEVEKARLKDEFKDAMRDYNRGSVIAAMAERGWDSYAMNRVLEHVTDSERAEAAVGLIKSGKYDSYDIRRILYRL